MSGGKGGGQTSKVEIPYWIEGPASRNLQRAEQLARMGYQPYYGPEVAAFNPMQIAGMQSAADAASAFGIAPQMNVASTIPQAQDFGNGLMGYGSGLGFESAVRDFQQNQPQQAAIYGSQFAGPNAGGYPQAGPPVMGGGGGEGGPTSGPLTGGMDAGLSMFGMSGPSFNNVPSMPTGQSWSPTSGIGPYVASGMGPYIPTSSMVGGGSIGSGKGGASAPISEAVPVYVNDGE